jgi:hypothetical protein
VEERIRRWSDKPGVVCSRRAGGSCLKFGNCEFVRFVGLAVALLLFFKSLYKGKIVVMNDWD